MSNICCFNKGDRCKILTVGNCVGPNCAFFKTQEQYEDGLKMALTRIASLNKAAQKHIALTYYKGGYPWLEVGDSHGC